MSCWQSFRYLTCLWRGKLLRAYFKAPKNPLFSSSGKPFTEGPKKSHMYWSFESSNSRFEPRFSSSVLFCRAHSIAGWRFRDFSSWRI